MNFNEFLTYLLKTAVEIFKDVLKDSSINQLYEYILVTDSTKVLRVFLSTA
jgi:ATP-dependent protease HslVU (ClpYQ) peptidase subunit